MKPRRGATTTRLLALVAAMLLSLLHPALYGQTPAAPVAAQDSTSSQADPAYLAPTQGAQSAAAGVSADVLEFAYRQIQLETERLDKLIRNAQTVGQLVVVLVVAFVAVLSFFGYKSVKDVKTELQESVENLVERNLKDKSATGATFEELVTRLESARARWTQIEKDLDNLAKFEALSSSAIWGCPGRVCGSKRAIKEARRVPRREASLSRLPAQDHRTRRRRQSRP